MQRIDRTRAASAAAPSAAARATLGRTIIPVIAVCIATILCCARPATAADANDLAGMYAEAVPCVISQQRTDPREDERGTVRGSATCSDTATHDTADAAAASAPRYRWPRR